MFKQRLYSVVTLTECLQDPATVAWLVHADIPLPMMTPPGRYPAPAEIQAAVDVIPGIRVDYHHSPSVWQVTVTSRKDVAWASLAVQDYTGDPEAAHRFYFEGGWDELILLVSTHLARICGPLVLLHDSGAPPQVVM